MTADAAPPEKSPEPDFGKIARDAGLVGTWAWPTPREEDFMRAAFTAGQRAAPKQGGERVCHVCKGATDLCCADCRIDLGAMVYVCAKPGCRDAHDLKCPARIAALEAALSPNRQTITKVLNGYMSNTQAQTLADVLMAALTPSPSAAKRRVRDERLALRCRICD